MNLSLGSSNCYFGTIFGELNPLLLSRFSQMQTFPFTAHIASQLWMKGFTCNVCYTTIKIRFKKLPASSPPESVAALLGLFSGNTFTRLTRISQAGLACGRSGASEIITTTLLFFYSDGWGVPSGNSNPQSNQCKKKKKSSTMRLWKWLLWRAGERESLVVTHWNLKPRTNEIGLPVWWWRGWVRGGKSGWRESSQERQRVIAFCLDPAPPPAINIPHPTLKQGQSHLVVSCNSKGVWQASVV